MIILVLLVVMFAMLPVLVHCLWWKHGQAKTMGVARTNANSPIDEQDQVQIDVNDETGDGKLQTDTDSTGTAPLPNNVVMVCSHPNTSKKSLCS